MMKRFALVLLALLALVPFSALAQSADPAADPAAQWTPTPKPINPHEYNDAAMHFVAPSAWPLMAYRVLPIDGLTDDSQMVAGWAGPDRTRPQAISISQQLFDGSTNGFETRFENDMRGKVDGLLVKSKTETSLQNGMPAYFIDMSFGDGFDARKEFALIWADGTRGVVISVVGRVGELDAATAKTLISNVSAVRYPAGRQ